MAVLRGQSWIREDRMNKHLPTALLVTLFALIQDGECRRASNRHPEGSILFQYTKYTDAARLQAKESTSSLQNEGTKLRGQDSKIYIIDTFPYNGELVTELRLKYLYGVVDEIMVVESRMTFSGKRKDFLYTDRDRRVFDPYIDKVTFLIIDEVPDPKEDWLKKNIASWMSNPIVWHRESYQRDYAASKIQSKHKGKKYVVLCSDIDEIPNRDFVTELSTQQGYEQAHEACYMAMNFSYYNFHWASPQDWMKAFAISDRGISRRSLNEYRLGNPYDGRVKQNAGWHLSYYMSVSDIARKLGSFGHTEYDEDQYRDPKHVKKCLTEGKDLFDRGPDFDMLPASPDRKAAYPEGWQELAAKLAKLQELPASSFTSA
ncbi:hypothetical protein CVIRNUC_000131 [Coccomyxa viridis]|uniref:Glycosyltransferase family 17 n=1 Tax=Coccomyxa viridis TaxID=1274662 RepID=A0AAV1HTY4_9CHLO|nr:hypothetical protein CVIRNUC_000131 [Coccomyxa viridis]